MRKIGGSIPAEDAPICTVQMALRGYSIIKGGGNGQSIVSTVSDAIVRTACGWRPLWVSHWATSVALLQVVDNWPHKQWW